VSAHGLSRCRGKRVAPRAERVFAANSEIELLIRDGNFARRKRRCRGLRAKRMTSLLLPQGIVADALGHNVDAQSAYQAAINKAIKDSDRATALAAAGQVAMRRSRWTEASDLLRAAHEIEPHNIDLIRALVAVDRHLGKYDEAVKLIRAVLAVAASRRDREVLAELSVSRKEWVRAASSIPHCSRNPVEELRTATD